ncbi:MAG: hypothetical protein R2748_00130 [Bryobacterales bacterium]
MVVRIDGLYAQPKPGLAGTASSEDYPQEDKLSGESAPECVSQPSERAELTLPYSRATLDPSRGWPPCLIVLSGPAESPKLCSQQCSARLRSPRAPPCSSLFRV